MKSRSVYIIVVIILFLSAGLFIYKQRGDEVALENNRENTMNITSSVFQDNGTIPSKYTCDGDNINPPLEIEGVPEEAVSLALLVLDPDIPASVKESRGTV
jgi:phosphatidylethanolamine-binding protein (PEBP) family uncharacterized protein